MDTLLTGASGLLGRAIYTELKKHFSVTGTAFSRAQGEIQKLDLLNFSAVREFVRKHEPQCILHSAAERHPDVCAGDKEKTRLLNIEATRVLAECAKEINAWMIYISTDYVFDGTAPPYTPKDRPNPLNIYGQSKLQGEKAVQETTKNFAILRVPVLYGEVEELKESAVTNIGQDVFSGEKRKYDNWAIRFPTHVKDVAIVLRQMIHRKDAISRFNGIFQWSGNEAFTKYGMAKCIAEQFNMPEELIQADNEVSPGVPRPKNSQLDTSILEELGIGAHTDFTDGIGMVLQEWRRVE